ncbi:MAG: c-type cytochrome, partial [Verrucomicrobia bacterium]|nr:c-type cytochrome [Verrucomicrobiota bacterium]
ASRAHTPVLTSFALRLGHAPAADAALQRVADAKTPEAERKKFLTLLAERRVAEGVPVFLELLRREKSDSLRMELVNALQRFDRPEIAATFLAVYPALSANLRTAVQGSLSSRVAWARALLEAVDTGALKKEQVSTANLLAIQGFKDAACDTLLKKHWGRLTKSSEEKEAQIAKVRGLLKTGRGDEKSGHEVFKLVCAVCHTLNNEGGKIGPDLSGYERDNLDFMLPSIVDPSLAIREEFTAFNVETKDDLSLTGFITETTPKAVTVMDLSGNKTVIARQDIKLLKASPTSLMPEGLLEAMTDQQVRDLFAYLMAGVRRVKDVTGKQLP